MRQLFIIISFILLLTSIFLSVSAREAAGIVFLLCACPFLILAFIEDIQKYIKEINFKNGQIIFKNLINSIQKFISERKK